MSSEPTSAEPDEVPNVIPASPAETETSAPPVQATPTQRIGSIDAYRGVVMFLLMAESLRLRQVSANFPESALWKFLAYHQTHVDWIGCSLHDMIQPSFSFLVGVSLPFSLAARRSKGSSTGNIVLHALWRSFLLVALGIFLRSVGRNRTNFTFEDTLSQIGLGYMGLFALAFYSRKIQWITCAAILVGYWALFAVWPLPAPDFKYANVGVASADAPQLLPGFQAHWNMNSNPAWAFDVWFLNLFPREKPFTHNGGGYSTISFIPTLATMILGLIAGGMMKDGKNPWKTGLIFIVLGAALTGAGYALGEAGICPVVKKIWTPSWVLFSGGLCFAALGAFVWICDAARLSPLFWPIRIIGANCIFVYVVIHWWDRFIQSNIKTHLGQDIFKSFGPGYEPLVAGAATMLVYWLIVAWMDKNRIRIRI